MFELRRQGHSVQAIARAQSRSSRTVHQVLTERGTQTLPDPEEQLSDAGLQEPDEVGRHKKNKRRRSGDNMVHGGKEPFGSLLQRLEPVLERYAVKALEANDDFALQLLGAYMDVKIPKKTIDDMLHEEIRANPDLRRQWAEDYLERQKRRGRTDTEIAAEVLGLGVELAKMMERGRWPDVVEKALTSGEVRKTVEAWLGRGAQGLQGLSGPTPAQPQVQPAGAPIRPLPEGSGHEPEPGSPPLSVPVAQPGQQALQPLGSDNGTDGGESERNQVIHQAVANPHGKIPPSMPDAAETRRCIAFFRGSFVAMVDWLDLEAGVQGDPRDFVAHLWESAQAGNSGHGVTLISLGDTNAFLESVGASVRSLQGDEGRITEYEAAIRVQNRLTETEEGRRWLEVACGAVISKLRDELANQNSAEGRPV